MIKIIQRTPLIIQRKQLNNCFSSEKNYLEFLLNNLKTKKTGIQIDCFLEQNFHY